MGASYLDIEDRNNMNVNIWINSVRAKNENTYDYYIIIKYILNINIID